MQADTLRPRALKCQDGKRCEGRSAAIGRRGGTRGPVQGAKDVVVVLGKVWEKAQVSKCLLFTAEVVGRKS